MQKFGGFRWAFSAGVAKAIFDRWSVYGIDTEGDGDKGDGGRGEGGGSIRNDRRSDGDGTRGYRRRRGCLSIESLRPQ